MMTAKGCQWRWWRGVQSLWFGFTASLGSCEGFGAVALMPNGQKGPSGRVGRSMAMG